MKWEAILVRLSKGVGVEDLPVGWQPPSLGTPEKVKATFEATFPKGEHVEGYSQVKAGGSEVEFIYGGLDDDSSVRVISVQCNAGLDTMPILRSASEKFGCRLFDLQTGQFADFGTQTEASMNDFVALRSRMELENRLAFALTVANVLIFYVLQDSGVIPTVASLSKVAVGVYSILGLVLLNCFAFLSSVLLALLQARELGEEVDSQVEKEKLEESILVPAFQGAGSPPSLIARFFHIPVGISFGMIAGAILAWVISLFIP